VIPLTDTVPTRHFPIVTVTLIALNVAVWTLYQLPVGVESVDVLGFHPCVIDGSCADQGVAWPVDVLTSMFAHGGWAHLIGNMLFLWIFGNNVEDAMGAGRFAAFYLLAGLVAAALQSWVTLTFGTEADAMVAHVGASGAIAGVLGAYVLLYPYAGVVALLFVFLVELPAALFIGWWFLLQLWLGSFALVVPAAGGGVAFFAHIGGFVFGLLAARTFAVHRRPRSVGPW
jgi:membrane associated rhomboid family serine protease